MKALAPQHPEWKDTQPFKAVLEGDMETLAKSGERGLLELLMATHPGMTAEEFEKIVTDWIATARHPRFKRPYTELAYQPMIELLAYLRANGFKTFIVSGGGIELMRRRRSAFTVCRRSKSSARGSRRSSRCVGRPELFRLPEVNFIDDTSASRSASISILAADRLPRSEIPTVISKCCSGRRFPEASALA